MTSPEVQKLFDDPQIDKDCTKYSCCEHCWCTDRPGHQDPCYQRESGCTGAEHEAVNFFEWLLLSR